MKMNTGLPAVALIEVGKDHRLADPEPLAALLRLCDGIDYNKLTSHRE